MAESRSNYINYFNNITNNNGNPTGGPNCLNNNQHAGGSTVHVDMLGKGGGDIETSSNDVKVNGENINVTADAINTINDPSNDTNNNNNNHNQNGQNCVKQFIQEMSTEL